MQALTISPGAPGSLRLDDIPTPTPSRDRLLVRALALGICGTDREILAGHYGTAPPGHDRLVIGHESLGVVERAPPQSGFAAGDRVVGVVRRPDPVPCPACAVGEWDMCRNGRYTERGIKERDGFGAEHFLLDPAFAVKVDSDLGLLAVLTEPASVVAKAWDHIERIGARSLAWRCRTVLVTGAGPVGLLAALMAVQRGHVVHVLDRAEHGPKPDLVRALGAIYHTGDLGDLCPDVVVECTGAPKVILDALRRNARDGIVCLTGVSSGGYLMNFDVGDFNREMVLENIVVFGSVNANLRHYHMAREALAKADPAWLGRLITRRVPLAHWHDAFEKRDDDIKVVITFSS
ncbi:MAG: glucose 1-dehydrogenase [Rhizobiales bacterium]|nr:glucose 1-dehydrogenase [Hyphomicrobiales bacterium]OJY40732.1 MAG: theronine dehydrogenase [Rhizobiales bacterium 64-17]